MKNKKADLSLSINAIVVLILAITMLGLGLAFMRNIFGSATKEFQEVGGTVKKQMIDQMKESDKVVELSRPKVELKQGESTQIFIGFKNEDSNPKYFKIKSDSNAKKPTSLGGYTNGCNLTAISGQGTYIEFKTTSTLVQRSDVVVIPINIKTTSSANIDTCFFELEVLDSASTFDTTPALTSSTSNRTIELTVDITS